VPDFIAMSRSNYFRVKNPLTFAATILELNLEHRMSGDTVMIYPEAGDWPSFDGNDNEIDFIQLIVPHLPPGEVCILHTVGYEKLQYLNHAMVAFTREGIILHHSQESFYDELNRLGHKFTRAEN